MTNPSIEKTYTQSLAIIATEYADRDALIFVTGDTALPT